MLPLFLQLLLIQSKVYVETTIQMAIQPSSIYHKMQEVFDKYENGQLKKQKIHSRKSEIGKKKFMQGHYSAKVHHFKVFQGLKVSSIFF